MAGNNDFSQLQKETTPIDIQPLANPKTEATIDSKAPGGSPKVDALLETIDDRSANPKKI